MVGGGGPILLLLRNRVPDDVGRVRRVLRGLECHKLRLLLHEAVPAGEIAGVGQVEKCRCDFR